LNPPSIKPANPNAVVISLALVALVLVAFWPVLSCGFLSLDDPDYFTANAHVVGGLTWSGIAWAFTSFFSSNWHPLTWLSLMADVSLFGQGPLGPHLVNLLLHVANTLLVFCILRRLTGKVWRSALVAGLFGLHPLRVESVAWVAERKDLLCAFFGLWCVLAYVRGNSGDLRHRRKWKLLALLFFVLGLMSKPMLVTLPFVLLLLDYWPLGRVPGVMCQVSGDKGQVPRAKDPAAAMLWRGKQGSGGFKILSGLVLEKWAFFLAAAAACVVTFFAQRAGGSVQSTIDYPLGERIANTFVSYARYLEKSFAPVDLAVPYPYPAGWPVGVVVLAVLLLVLWLGMAFALRRRAPHFTMGSLWFVGMLVPVIGLVQVGGQSMADRYTYLPQIGLWLAVVWAVGEWWAHGPAAKSVLALAAGLALAICAVKTNVQSRDWTDTETLMKHALAVTEKNTLAYFNLGSYYDGKGRREEAIQCYRKAVEGEPDFVRGHMNLANDLIAREDYAGGFEQYREVLRLDPGLALAHNNYGVALSETREYDGAMEQYRRALELEPDYADAHYNLGVMLATQKRYEEAIPHYLAAAKKVPRAITYNNLGYALGATGHAAEALAAYRQAVALDPNMFEARVNLGNALAKENDLAGAVENYRAVLGAGTNNPALLNNLGHALAGQKKWDEAIADYQAALRLAPDFTLARFNLGMALLEQGHPELALAEYERLLESQPENAQFEYARARALMALGRNAEALAAATEALRLKPGYAEAREMVERLGRE